MAREFKKVGVVGLGTMGAGIAEVLARSGIEVVGYEPEQEGVDRGRARLEGSTARAVAKGKLDQAAADALLAVGWIEAIMVALQTLQLAVTLVLPSLGALLGIAALLLAAYLMVALTMAVHGFRNPLLVVMGILGTVMLTSFLLSILAATLGFLPGAPA